MIHDSATHTFEAVLVWKLDRFSRNRYDSAHYKRILKNNRVHVVSVTEPISNTPEGIMLESLLEGMAEYYSAELAEKVSRGHKENAPQGQVSTAARCRWGTALTASITIRSTRPPHRWCRKRSSGTRRGESIRSIIESLNARGIRNSRGNPFTKNSFQTLLKNRGIWANTAIRIPSSRMPSPGHHRPGVLRCSPAPVRDSPPGTGPQQGGYPLSAHHQAVLRQVRHHDGRGERQKPHGHGPLLL